MKIPSPPCASRQLRLGINGGGFGANSSAPAADQPAKLDRPRTPPRPPEPTVPVTSPPRRDPRPLTPLTLGPAEASEQREGDEERERGSHDRRP